MYSEGLGFRAIARIKGVHNTTVMRWVAKLGKEIASKIAPIEGNVSIMELDELWHPCFRRDKLCKKLKNSGSGLHMTVMEDESVPFNLVRVIQIPVENSTSK